MDSEVRQKFEAYMDTVPTIPDGVDSFDIFSAGFEAGMRAGEIAMREKALKAVADEMPCDCGFDENPVRYPSTAANLAML